jgi:alpha-beta hydrolase superfamily lysophospholipase
MEILIDVPALGRGVPGSLTIPPSPRGVVAFAHGSGSSRLSPRNAFVAETLQRRGIATLLFDLLTPQEDRDPEARFDIPLLTRRLLAASDWLSEQDATARLPLGYFGASTGAAAALEAAAERGAGVSAVVSRGGRPDLAGSGLLEAVSAPTLLIVGGLDDVVIGLNRKAMARLSCEKELVVVPGATHLFEEPGTLAQAAGHAADWFARWLS